jgi:putative transposase
LREEAREQLETVVGIQASCRITGISRSTLYRRRAPKQGKTEPVVRPAPPNALTGAERDRLITVLNSQEFADKSVRQVWAALLDRGVYLASPSTMYRELRARDQVRERRAHARHEAKKKPQLEARAPNAVWSWDSAPRTRRGARCR